jgi:hypothetical protein
MSNKTISIYDTTLRDGAQTVGISFSLHDKLLIAGAGGGPVQIRRMTSFFETSEKPNWAIQKSLRSVLQNEKILHAGTTGSFRPCWPRMQKSSRS